MVTEILAFGGVLFFGLVGFVVLILAAQIHNERIGWAFTTFIFAIAALLLFSNVPSLLKNTPPLHYLYAFGGYLGIAALWAVIKWRCFFLPNMFRQYADLRETFLRNKGLKEMPTDQKTLAEFNDDWKVKSLGISHNRMVRNNKARITTWMVFWWASLIDTFIGEFLVNLFDYIYRSMAGTLQRMSDGMASKYSELN